MPDSRGGEIRRISEEQLRTTATNFLKQHNADGTIPVPIDRIVEEMGIEVIPVSDLLSGKRGINGFLTADCKSIMVDQYLWNNVESRYLFTIAHEVGHFVLHRQFYGEFKNESELRALREKFQEHEIEWAEWQANTFAGLVLIPTEKLRERIRQIFDDTAKPVLSQDPRFDVRLEQFWTIIASKVGDFFRTSRETARIRLQKEGFWCKDIRDVQ